MPLLQPASSPHGNKVPKPLRINKPAISVSSSSSSPSPQQARPRARLVSDLHNLEYPEPLRIRRSNSTTPLPSPSSRPRLLQPTQPLPTNKSSIHTPLLPASAPHQHRRLEISPIPLRPRLSPPSKEKPVDSAHRKSDRKTPRTPTLLIKREFTYHTISEPARPTLPTGNHVSITTGSTPLPPKSSSRFLSIPPSPFRDEKKLPIRDIFDTGAILPAPITQTLANQGDIIPFPSSSSSSSSSSSPPHKKQRTEIKGKLTGKRRTLSALLPWNPDPRLEDDLEAIDEKLRVTAQAVVKSGEKWRRYATFLPTRSAFDGVQGTTRTALRGVLEDHGYPGRRVGEKLEVMGNGGEWRSRELVDRTRQS